MVEAVFNRANWVAVPFHFWSAVIFVFGCMVGSFLNVCIYRMPLGLSVVSPPSHCPHCKYSIPWYLNMPLVTWLWLRGKCRNCGAPISIRYFLVELLTGMLFLTCWLFFGNTEPGLALIYAFFCAGLMVATFIDFEHFIIPDSITVGGMLAGFVIAFLYPTLHGRVSVSDAVRGSLIGAAVGAGVVYTILRLGKLLFGRQRVALPAGASIVFTETAICLPDKQVPYEEIFYRASDTIFIKAQRVELVDRCYFDTLVRLNPESLQIGEEKFVPSEVPYMQTLSQEIVLPREAMGFGDVKFMAAIGAFLGWPAVLFSLLVSSLIGSLVGVGLIIMRRREMSSRLPYGPYIAMAAAIWLFGGQQLVRWWIFR